MSRFVESTDRAPTDYFHFGITFLGVIMGVAGIATLSMGAGIIGVLLISLGMAYFLVDN